MKLGMGCFGLVCAALVAIPTAAAVVTEMRQEAGRIAHPFARYQLTFELDGQFYIIDHDLTLSDCESTLASTRNDPSSFRNGQGKYSCDLQPNRR